MPELKTQRNSKARVKKDAIGDEGLKALFFLYNKLSVVEFRTYCLGLILNSAGSQATKDTFYSEIARMNSKDQMVKKVTNYLLAGQGLGV